MKFKSIFILMLILVIAACSDDSSTEPEEIATEQVEADLRKLDQMIFKMAGSQMVGMMDAMPGGLIDISSIFSLQNDMLLNATKNDIASLQKTANDTSIIDLIGQLINLFGTHTWDGSQWVYSDSPDDEVVIIFPYQDQTSETEQTVTVRFYDLDLSNSNLGLSVEVLVDDVKMLSINVDVNGSNLLIITSEPEITNVTVSGTFLDNDGIEYEFSVSVTDDKIEIFLGPTGEDQLKITVEGNGLLEGVQNDQDPDITKVTVEYGSVTIVVDDPVAEQGDIGDVFYEGIKVADLVIKEDGELYIVYLNDDEKLFSSVMTSFGLISQFNN